MTTATEPAPTRHLHDRGQSLWLDNITRAMLDDGTIGRYIDRYAVTGLTSKPSIYDKAIRTDVYDEAIKDAASDRSNDDVFFDLAIEDLRRAADLFAGIHHRTNTVDGWVSLQVSPALAHDTEATVDAARRLHSRAARTNLFIKIPGTPEGLPAIEAATAAGIPVNITLLFDADQYRAAADAYLKGIEHRLEQGLNPCVGSVASMFMSRWDVAVADFVPQELHNRLALAVGRDIYRAYGDVQRSERWLRLANAGARMQRLLWASTSTKDPDAPDTLYVEGLAAPFTINTMPDATLEAFQHHGTVTGGLGDGPGSSDTTLASFAEAGVDLRALATKLQVDGAAAFVASWNDLISVVEAQRASMPANSGA